MVTSGTLRMLMLSTMDYLRSLMCKLFRPFDFKVTIVDHPITHISPHVLLDDQDFPLLVIKPTLDIESDLSYLRILKAPISIINRYWK